jgi:tRNA A37 threonylcarbamoyltransferase TsaD
VEKKFSTGFSTVFPQPRSKDHSSVIIHHSSFIMNNTERATIASIAATIGLGLWLALALSSQTAELLARCKQGPEPAACELRLLGR